MQKIVGVKRSIDKNISYFLEIPSLNMGDKVVVSIDDFLTVATVSKVGIQVDDEKAKGFERIVRKATDEDISKFEKMSKKAMEQLPEIKKKSLELGLMMKFVGAEYSLDNQKILIIFSSEERVDFRQFLKELASMLKIRIELKQIGQRDEIKISGGVGPCGEPCCCGRFLKDFNHVTVKMAKSQGLSLSPTKINGVCGRLMCCLGYEADSYEEMLKKMPKVGSEVVSPKGKGIVVYNDILREKVSVKRQADGDSFIVEDYPLEEIEFQGKVRVNLEKQIEKIDNEKEIKDLKKEKPIDDKNENKSNFQEKKEFDKTKNKKESKKTQENGAEEMDLGLPEKKQNDKNQNANIKNNDFETDKEQNKTFKPKNNTNKYKTFNKNNKKNKFNKK